ncbi:MAG: restriction endonuclease subunit S [Gammaproteobacteria bacterium]|nr:restriction endonuclease subunit S [Gammaproteobacteria bacterium]
MLELAYGKSLPATKRKSGDIPVFGSGGISGFHDEKLVNGPGLIVGRKGTVGSLYWSEDDFFPIDTVFYVVKKVQLPLYWLYQSLQLIDIKSMGADSAVPGVNRNNIYARHILIPSDELLEKYLIHINSYNTRIKLIEQQNDVLTKTRDSLLPKLLSGEIQVPEAEAIIDQHLAEA